MPRLIKNPVVVHAAGNKPKLIEEFVGRPSTNSSNVSVARMRSPSGWEEPGQRPDFQEVTLVLKGALRVEHEAGEFLVQAGEAVITLPGEWVRYSTPGPDGAEYVAICFPAFSPDSVHRDS
jgi:quercetin dioxygenase-like cupin family protein